MKNTIMILLAFAAFAPDRPAEPTIEITRQRSSDPNFNGLHFQVELTQQEIDDGRFGLFLTRKDLKEAWYK